MGLAIGKFFGLRSAPPHSTIDRKSVAVNFFLSRTARKGQKKVYTQTCVQKVKLFAWIFLDIVSLFWIDVTGRQPQGQSPRGREWEESGEKMGRKLGEKGEKMGRKWGTCSATGNYRK